MPMLLEDLAEETLAHNRRAADRLEAEVREVDHPQTMNATIEEIRQRVIESARQASDYAIRGLPQAEGGWELALIALRKKPFGEDTDRLLRIFLSGFETGQRLVRSPRDLWKIAQTLGVTPERLDELDRVEERFKKLAAEARSAIEHRQLGWQPADPDRLALGLQMSRAGQTVKAEQARARFTRTQK